MHLPGERNLRLQGGQSFVRELHTSPFQETGRGSCAQSVYFLLPKKLGSEGPYQTKAQGRVGVRLSAEGCLTLSLPHAPDG